MREISDIIDDLTLVKKISFDVKRKLIQKRPNNRLLRTEE